MRRRLRPVGGAALSAALVTSLALAAPGAGLDTLRPAQPAPTRPAPLPSPPLQPALSQPTPSQSTLPSPARSGVYFAPTPEVVADAMLVLAGVTPNDVVFDLGSGDGRIVVLAAQKYGARGVGVEIDARLVELARTVAREGAIADRVRFIEGDLFAADLSTATVVTLWLSPSMNADLEAKLRRELRPGARVVSRQFPIARWTPTAEREVNGERLYLWRL